MHRRPASGRPAPSPVPAPAPAAAGDRSKERPKDPSPAAVGDGDKDPSWRRRKAVLYSGVITAVGISMHNFPEGIAVFLGSIKVLGTLHQALLRIM